MYAPLRSGPNQPSRLARTLLAFFLLLATLSFARPASAQSDAAQFISQTPPPSTIIAGHTYSVSVTMQNTGTSTWKSGSAPNGGPFAGYDVLQSANPAANSTWSPQPSAPNGFNWNVPLSATGSSAPITPGQIVTFSFTITAPAPGSYHFCWQMANVYDRTFGQFSSDIIIRSIDASTDDAAFVSQTPPPSTLIAGHTYPVSVTMKNIGATTWVTGPPSATAQPTGYMLVAQNPTGTNHWNTNPGTSYYNNAVPIAATGAASVAPGQTATFSFTITAPSTPGT